MKWTTKSKIQNSIARLPTKYANHLYYQVLKKTGGITTLSPNQRISASIAIADAALTQGIPPSAASVLEVGTGYRVSLPIGLWLCGIKELTTVDLNPYLKMELVRSDISYIQNNQGEIESLFNSKKASLLDKGRLKKIVNLDINSSNLLQQFDIKYISPADATKLAIADSSMDLHISYTVLEHIPPPTLSQILVEGSRILCPGGCFIHIVDFSDHFSHSDKSISSANFLRFNEKDWDALAGNQFMYQNRLRFDDYVNIFEECDLSVFTENVVVDKQALKLLEEGFPIDSRFRDKSAKSLATTEAMLIAQL